MATFLCAIRTHLSLDHQNSLGSHFLHEFWNVENSFLLHPLHHCVQSDEGASPANTGTAVHQQGRARGRVGLADALDEGKHAGLVGRNSVIRPGREVVVSHLQLSSVFIRGLKRRKNLDMAWLKI